MTEPAAEQQPQYCANTTEPALTQADRHGCRPEALQPRFDALHRQLPTRHAPFKGATITPFALHRQLLRPERANPGHALSPRLPGALHIGRGHTAEQVSRLIEPLQQLGYLRPTQRLRIGMGLGGLHR